jgi:Na+/melibiose symporter-like transporter
VGGYFERGGGLQRDVCRAAGRVQSDDRLAVLRSGAAAVFLYIPAARFLERRARRTPWIWGSLFLARVGYGLIVMLPWVIPAQYQGAALVWLLIAISVPSTFFATGFNPLLADVIPERDRARVFANRNIINGMVVATLTFLAGRWLDTAAQIDWATFPRNFQILYVIGFLGAATSSWYLLKIKVPDSKVIAPEPQEHGARPKPAQIIANARRFVAENRGFVRITANTLAFGFGDWLLAPVYTIFFLRHLGASDGWVGLNSTLANVGVIVGYTLWRKWIEQLGHNRTLLITIPLSACYPFLVSLFPNLTLILIWGHLHQPDQPWRQLEPLQHPAQTLPGRAPRLLHRHLFRHHERRRLHRPADRRGAGGSAGHPLGARHRRLFPLVGGGTVSPLQGANQRSGKRGSEFLILSYRKSCYLDRSSKMIFSTDSTESNGFFFVASVQSVETIFGGE